MKEVSKSKEDEENTIEESNLGDEPKIEEVYEMTEKQEKKRKRRT